MYTENQDRVRERHALAVEANEIAEAIRPFFTAEKWGEWLKAHPNTSVYYRHSALLDEWQNIHDEFCLDEPPTPEAERQAAEIARDAHWLGTVSEPDGTHPSPIISGGEVLELGNFTNPDEEIPF